MRSSWAYLVMPKLDGGDLAEILAQRGRVSPADTRVIFLRVRPPPPPSKKQRQPTRASQRRRLLPHQPRAERSRTRPLPAQVLAGLEFIHAMGVCHRDLKVRGVKWLRPCQAPHAAPRRLDAR